MGAGPLDENGMKNIPCVELTITTQRGYISFSFTQELYCICSSPKRTLPFQFNDEGNDAFKSASRVGGASGREASNLVSVSMQNLTLESLPFPQDSRLSSTIIGKLSSTIQNHKNSSE